MVSDALGRQLHDRATCGEPLSAKEQKQLETWHKAQDRAELEMLSQIATPGSPGGQ